MIKSIIHPVTGRRVFFGRRRPSVVLPRLTLRNVMTTSLPAPPDVCDYFTTNVTVPLGQMDGNDTVGNCVEAEMLHTAGVLTGNANGAAGALVATPDQGIQLYSDITGYIPGDPSTDNGTLVTDALTYWQQTGLMPGTATPHKIAGYLALNSSDLTEIKTAIWLFENISIAFELPDAWITPFPSASGFVWSVAGPPDPDNGHDVLGFSYDSLGVLIDTWGIVGHLAWPALTEYCSSANGGEIYTVISPDQLSIAKQRTPTGIAWSTLESYFTDLGGTLAVA